jgi:hypothetical protein
MIELRVVSGGTVEGIRVEARAGTDTAFILATLPDLIVANDDIIVIHLGTGYALDVPGSEMIAKDQYPTATYAQNYDAAWDVRGSMSGVANTSDQTLTIYTAGQPTDAAAFTDANGTTLPAFLASLSYLQGAGEWLPANCGGFTCSDTSTPTAEGIAADWSGVGNTVTGNTIQRVDNSDDHNAADWQVTSHTLGLLNAGQSPP